MSPKHFSLSLVWEMKKERVEVERRKQRVKKRDQHEGSDIKEWQGGLCVREKFLDACMCERERDSTKKGRRKRKGAAKEILFP